MDSKWTDAGKVLALKSDFKAVGLNFVGSSEPTTPEEGQGWYDSTNNFIRWYDGANWTNIAVFIGSSAPATPVEGNVWFDTTNHFLKAYDGSAWSCLGTFVGTGAPGTPVEGLIWYESTNDIVKAYDGAAWSNLMTRIANAAPATPTEGLVWWDAVNDLLKAYNGATWDTMQTAGNIGQAQINTATEEESADVATATWTLFTFSNPGGYGFNTQVAFEESTSDAEARIYYEATGNETYQDTVAVYHASGDARMCYAKMRYITACGEICWLFILKDKETGKYIRMHKSPDHPAICCHDVDKVHHPFNHCYNESKHTILCIPLTKEEQQEVEDMQEWRNELPALTFLQAVQKYFDIDEKPKKAKWPDIPVTIGVDRKGKDIKAKIPKRDYIKQAKLIKK